MGSEVFNAKQPCSLRGGATELRKQMDPCSDPVHPCPQSNVVNDNSADLQCSKGFKLTQYRTATAKGEPMSAFPIVAPSGHLQASQVTEYKERGPFRKYLPGWPPTNPATARPPTLTVHTGFQIQEWE